MNFDAQIRMDGIVHQGLIRGMIDNGHCPSAEELAGNIESSVHDVRASLRRLEKSHAVVLHPHECSVWVVHPFAVSPTHTWVEQGERGWWAPCIWCALGIATLVGGEVTIHARIGGESEQVRIPAEDGYPKITGIMAHFALPAEQAWNNVHHYCAMLLPFRLEGDIDAWASRHGLPRGQAVAIEQLAQLARAWYGGHADAEFRKCSPGEAQRMFADAGLTGEFWQLSADADRF